MVATLQLDLDLAGFDLDINTALVLIAGLVVFFPIRSTSTLGLKSADFNFDLMWFPWRLRAD